ncbi:MAG TPA: tetratricopeptide repeat protein, partial [Leptolyngbyaceae cyanobacterium M65_K2018_010]|nr:tetratricopeptide repeat protein [Leptolyngbyaceae cyanobacterium M65_K2018_010]
DEVIVVDTGSQDDTAAIAQSCGAQVYAWNWTNDFATARNASLGYATGDWVLVLDADERLQPQIAPVLRHLDQGQPVGGVAAQDIVAVNLLRLELGAPQAPYTLITRFFRRLPEISFHRPYHETVDDSIAHLQNQNPHWQVITLTDVALHHSGYDPAVVVQRGKFERARTTMEQYLAEHPDDGYVLNKLAALYLETDHPEAALPLLDRALNQGNGLDPITRYELHYHRALAYQIDHSELAAQDYQAALEQPVPPILKLGAWVNYGSLKKNQGALTEAIALFEQAIAVDPTLAVAYYNLGTAQRARGYLDEAIAAYRQAIALQPSYAEAHQNLGVALFKLGQLPESLQAFSQAIQLYEGFDPDRARSLKQGVQNLGVPPALLGHAHLL